MLFSFHFQHCLLFDWLQANSICWMKWNEESKWIAAAAAKSKQQSNDWIILFFLLLCNCFIHFQPIPAINDWQLAEMWVMLPHGGHSAMFCGPQKQSKYISFVSFGQSIHSIHPIPKPTNKLKLLLAFFIWLEWNGMEWNQMHAAA